MSIGGAPRVSIGLPVYNGGAWLRESIDSLLSQTYRDFELIISDNASTDDTEAVCRAYAAADPRVRYSRNASNIGGMRNASLTFRMARGEYFRWAAHDDICAPTLLERLVEELDRRPEVVVCVSPAVLIDAQNAPVRNRETGTTVEIDGLRLRRRTLFTNDGGYRHPAEGTAATPHERFAQLALTKGPCEADYGLMRTSALRRTGLLRDFTESDYVLLCELALAGPFHVVDEPLFFKRLHPGNLIYERRGPWRMVWSRPELAERGTITLPHWLGLTALLQSLRRAAIPRTEKLRCATALLAWMWVQRKALAWDVAAAIVMRCHSREWRRRAYDPERWGGATPTAASSAAPTASAVAASPAPSAVT